MDRDIATERRFDRAAERTLVGGRSIARQGCYTDPFGQPAGNALVERVDRAADRLAAEQQHGGTMDDIDVIDRQRIEHDRVIGRNR